VISKIVVVEVTYINYSKL